MAQAMVTMPAVQKTVKPRCGWRDGEFARRSCPATSIMSPEIQLTEFPGNPITFHAQLTPERNVTRELAPSTWSFVELPAVESAQGRPDAYGQLTKGTRKCFRGAAKDYGLRCRILFLRSGQRSERRSNRSSNAVCIEPGSGPTFMGWRRSAYRHSFDKDAS